MILKLEERMVAIIVRDKLERRTAGVVVLNGNIQDPEVLDAQSKLVEADKQDLFGISRFTVETLADVLGFIEAENAEGDDDDN